MVMRRRYMWRARRLAALGARSCRSRLSQPLSALHCTMWRCSCVALLLAALLLLWGADAAPLFGLLSLLSGGSTNGTGLLESLVLAHLQEKINKLQVLGDLLAIAANATG